MKSWETQCKPVSLTEVVVNVGTSEPLQFLRSIFVSAWADSQYDLTIEGLTLVGAVGSQQLDLPSHRYVEFKPGPGLWVGEAVTHTTWTYDLEREPLLHPGRKLVASIRNSSLADGWMILKLFADPTTDDRSSTPP